MNGNVNVNDGTVATAGSKINGNLNMNGGIFGESLNVPIQEYRASSVIVNQKKWLWNAAITTEATISSRKGSFAGILKVPVLLILIFSRIHNPIDF